MNHLFARYHPYRCNKHGGARTGAGSSINVLTSALV
jgi:hypothetical protein